MDVELTEIRDFLASHEPFSLLPDDVLDRVPASLTMRYFRRGSTLWDPSQATEEMFLVRSGSIDIIADDGSLLDRRDIGEGVGGSALMRGRVTRKNRVVAHEDTLVLVVSRDVFFSLMRASQLFENYYLQRLAARMQVAVQGVQTSAVGEPILKTRLRDLIKTPPPVADQGASIRDAARKMRDEGVSCLLVLDGERLAGIVTDRDLRNRVVAAGHDALLPVSTIMSRDPVVMDGDAVALELVLEMAGGNIHHVPVMERGRLAGLLTSDDLMRLQHANPIYVVGDIDRQRSLPGLVEMSKRTPRIVEQLVSEDAAAEDMGLVVTAVGDAIERRLIWLAESELGPPPVPYCWVVLGSQARQEQGLSSDQDNALVLSDEARPEHEEYFAALATRVSDGLEACGYAKCTGDVMATNPAWRQPLSVWRRTFATWMSEPDPRALVNASIFFDMRAVHGDHSLLEQLRERVLQAAPSASVFLTHLTKHAVEHQPPLGFFRGFVLEKDGEGRQTLDLKRGGVGAVVELARVYALSQGLAPVNTHARLEAAAEAGALSTRRMKDLRHAFEFISYVRLRHQARQVRTGTAPDNFVPPSELTSIERRQLRDVFQIVRRAQMILAQSKPLHYVS